MTQSQPNYKPGDKIGGRYQVHEAKMGGMGEVYLCLDLETNLPFALKTFQRRYQSVTLRKAFEQEVATWVALEKHPNIVRCFWMDILDNQPFMVLEWIAGEAGKGSDLRGWLQHSSLDLELVMKITIDICRGLIHARQKQPGLVHRDLKPENILITQGRLAKITDFGLAEIAQKVGLEPDTAEGEADSRKRITGTPTYMAPEQWRNEALDTRTDLYAIGCILYEMVVGHPPFSAATLSDLQTQHLTTAIPKLAGNQQFPVLLNTVLARCLAKRKETRMAGVEDLLCQLEFIYHQQFGTLPTPISAEAFAAIDYNNRGVTYYNLGRHEAALADYNQALQLDPTLTAAYANRGSLIAYTL